VTYVRCNCFSDLTFSFHSLFINLNNECSVLVTVTIFVCTWTLKLSFQFSQTFNHCIHIFGFVIMLLSKIIIESNICSIKLQTSNSKGKIQTLQLINVYNSCSLSIIFTEESSTISRLNELIKDDCEQLVVEDFNLHHSHWEGRRCFTHHTATNALLDIITNARLELLLESGTITRKTHNQLTTINLAFDSEKIQFMIYKCKIRINLHQKFDHLSIVMKLCLRTFFMQFTTRWLWKKMNTEALNAHLRIHFLVDHFLDNKTTIDDRVAEITHVLQEIIEESTSWAKSLI